MSIFRSALRVMAAHKIYLGIMAEDLRHNRRNSCRRSAASYG